MTGIRAPKGLNAVEKALFRSIIAELKEAGVDPKGRFRAIKAYVEGETRIAEMRAIEGEDRVLQAHRAVTRLGMEQRRLRNEIFAKPKESDPLSAEEKAQIERYRQRDAAWREFDREWSGRHTSEAYRTAEAAMIGMHGPWPWSVLCHETFEDAVAEGWAVGLPVPDHLDVTRTHVRKKDTR